MPKKPYSEFFKTLGNKTRLDIIYALRKKSLNVTQLTEQLSLNQTTASHNLKRLLTCHFISQEKRGLHHYYALNHETIKPLLKIIDKHAKKYCAKQCVKK